VLLPPFVFVVLPPLAAPPDASVPTFGLAAAFFAPPAAVRLYVLTVVLPPGLACDVTPPDAPAPQSSIVSVT
jgi:hypothetical protein